MSETTATAEPSRLSVGAVFRRAFDLMMGDFVKFFALAFIVWLPVLITLFIVGFGHAAWSDFPAPSPSAGIAGAVLVGLLTWAAFILSQAVILYGAIERMRGQSFALAESLQRGFARFFPLVGLYLALAIILGIGFVLLVVPGILLAVALYVALPVCLVEKRGPLESLRRSADLTKGNRWRIFGIALLLYIGSEIGQVIIHFTLRLVGGRTLAELCVFLWTVAVGALASILVAVVYHDLRVAHEGVDIEHIAQHFD
jgi:hypothetical protein